MNRVLLAVGLSFLAVEAQAISDYTSTSMSCEAVQATVRGEGAVILRHRSTRVPGLQLFDRYVRDYTFCQSHEMADFAFVPTADRQSCRVKECEPRDNDDLIFRRR